MRTFINLTCYIFTIVVLTSCNKSTENNQSEVDSTLSLSNLKDEEETPEVGVLELAAQHSNLQVFTTAAGLIDLQEILDKREGQFTVFAPTDQAFSEAGIVISKEDTTQNEMLKDILLQHIISQHTVSEFWIDEVSYPTLNNGTITIEVKDSAAYVNGAKIIVANIVGEGGALHIIEEVLSPNPEKETTASKENIN